MVKMNLKEAQFPKLEMNCRLEIPEFVNLNAIYPKSENDILSEHSTTGSVEDQLATCTETKWENDLDGDLPPSPDISFSNSSRTSTIGNLEIPCQIDTSLALTKLESDFETIVPFREPSRSGSASPRVITPDVGTLLNSEPLTKDNTISDNSYCSDVSSASTSRNTSSSFASTWLPSDCSGTIGSSSNLEEDSSSRDNDEPVSKDFIPVSEPGYPTRSRGKPPIKPWKDVPMNVQNYNLKKAIDDILGEGKSLRAAAIDNNVPAATLYRDASLPRRKTVLTVEEETDLADYAVKMAQIGYGLIRFQITNKVTRMIEEDGRRNPFQDGKPSKNWWSGFLKRNPRIPRLPSTTRPKVPKPNASNPNAPKPNDSNHDAPKPNDSNPAAPKPNDSNPAAPKPNDSNPNDSNPIPAKPNDSNPNASKPNEPKPNAMKTWLKKYREFLSKLNMLDGCEDRIWSFGEYSFTTCHESGKIVVLGASETVFTKSRPPKSQMIVLSAISAEGDFLTPFQVYNGSQLTFNPRNTLVGRSTVAISKSGWMTKRIFYNWLEFRFLPSLPRDRPVVLLVDGLSCQIGTGTTRLCSENQIELFCLPPHLTHVVPPSDVEIQEFREFNLAKRNSPQLRKSFEMSMSPDLIIDAFESIGICPLDPDS